MDGWENIPLFSAMRMISELSSYFCLLKLHKIYHIVLLQYRTLYVCRISTHIHVHNHTYTQSLKVFSFQLSTSAAAAAKSPDSCPTLCNPMDCSPPNSSVHGIFHARTLEWVAMPSSRGIFPIQVLNPHLLCRLHWQMDSLPIVPPGKPIAPWFTSNHQPHGHRLFTDLTFNPALRLHGGRTAGSPIRMNN